MATKEQKTILIIEDELILAQALNVYFGIKYSVVIKNDSQSGFDYIMNEKPDVVLLDIFLPKMNGFDILEQCKANPDTKDIPVIIMSNCGGDEDVRKGLDLGAEKYLVKADTQLSDIVAEVEKYL